VTALKLKEWKEKNGREFAAVMEAKSII